MATACVGTSIEQFHCGICFDVLVDPVVGHCGHDFCQVCILKWTQFGNDEDEVHCPNCREVFAHGSGPTPAVCVRMRDVIQQLFPAEVTRRRKEHEQTTRDQPVATAQPLTARWRFASDLNTSDSNTSDSNTSTPMSNISTPFSQDSAADAMDSLGFITEPGSSTRYAQPPATRSPPTLHVGLPHTSPTPGIRSSRTSRGPASHPVPDDDFPASPSSTGGSSPVPQTQPPPQRQGSASWWWDEEQDAPVPLQAACPESARSSSRPSSRQQSCQSRLLQSAMTNYAAHLEAAAALYDLEHPQDDWQDDWQDFALPEWFGIEAQMQGRAMADC